MMLCATLSKMQGQRYVDFDPTNPEHMVAFQMQCLGNYEDTGVIHIRQHKTLRFNLEQPFLDVPSMMNHKVGKAYMKMMGMDTNS